VVAASVRDTRAMRDSCALDDYVLGISVEDPGVDVLSAACPMTAIFFGGRIGLIASHSSAREMRGPVVATDKQCGPDNRIGIPPCERLRRPAK
jgi:hypothetical protein